MFLFHVQAVIYNIVPTESLIHRLVFHSPTMLDISGLLWCLKVEKISQGI